MELSNLINNNTTSYINQVPQQQQQQQQQQQYTKMIPVQVPQQKQHIKLPSIHEIINISELNYQIASNKNNNQQQYYTPPLNSNYNYSAYKQQPQQPQPHPVITSLVSNSNNHNINDARSSPIQSIIHSPIESPVFQRSLSSTSSISSSDQHSDFNQSTTSVSTSKINGNNGIISRSQNGRKGRSNLPKKTTMILVDWLYKNINHPYPNPKQKSELIYQTGLSSQQLSNWFINARRRKIRSLKFQEEEKYIL